MNFGTFSVKCKFQHEQFGLNISCRNLYKTEQVDRKEFGMELQVNTYENLLYKTVKTVSAFHVF